MAKKMNKNMSISISIGEIFAMLNIIAHPFRLPFVAPGLFYLPAAALQPKQLECLPAPQQYAFQSGESSEQTYLSALKDVKYGFNEHKLWNINRNILEKRFLNLKSGLTRDTARVDGNSSASVTCFPASGVCVMQATIVRCSSTVNPRALVSLR